VNKYTIYTDGGSSGNPGPAGWGAIILGDNTRLEISGPMESATNNQAELTAAIEALRVLAGNSEVELFSDS
jgi:ribonuclease HI